jgi:hypothetical protein
MVGKQLTTPKTKVEGFTSLKCRFGAQGSSREPRSVYPRPMSPNAPTRRPLSWIYERAGTVLADDLQPPATGDSLPRDTDVDTALVLTSRGPLVPRGGLPRPPRGSDGPAGGRPAMPPLSSTAVASSR